MNDRWEKFLLCSPTFSTKGRFWVTVLCSESNLQKSLQRMFLCSRWSSSWSVCLENDGGWPGDGVGAAVAAVRRGCWMGQSVQGLLYYPFAPIPEESWNSSPYGRGRFFWPTFYLASYNVWHTYRETEPTASLDFKGSSCLRFPPWLELEK